MEQRIFTYFFTILFIILLSAILYNYSNYLLYKFASFLCSVLFRLTVLSSLNSFTIRTELDFKSEYLFRTCSVVIILVTSPEFQLIRCATTLFHFGRTRNGCVPTRIFLLSSTAESSATSGYVVGPECSGQSEA